ncbi:unnamed protein product [Schistocephalus solidus]|uniref:Secreted protein n=1 Tax=Schistocephalus solidus TaxID=70667 RepID=A0A183SEN5_SCHSO|nr:unnamed protein product [Schistocephalus solidus]
MVLIMLPTFVEFFGQSRQCEHGGSRVVNTPSTVPTWYPALTCGSWKLGAAQRQHIGNRVDRRVKPSEDIWCRSGCSATKHQSVTYSALRQSSETSE